VTWVRQTWAIARRELGAYLLSPIAWVVLVLFLVVQGASFVAVLNVLADPHRPAPYGAVLRAHFGGTFLYWAFLFFVIAVTTMRLVAEEKRHGTWETLRTAPVAEGAVVVGKWLGALGFYAFLWAPTLVYVAILAALAPPGAAPDGGPVATAYLGVLVTGGSFLALGLACSAVTSNQIVAAVVAFVASMLLLLAGVIPEVAPDVAARHATLAALARAIDVRRHMDDFARGVIDTSTLVLHGGFLVAALAAATLWLAAERQPRRLRPATATAAALVVTATLLVDVLAARHPARLDFTRARVYTLDPRTEHILADVHRPVRILVLSAGRKEFAPLYDEVRELLRRFQAGAPSISVAELDPALDPGRTLQLAQELALQPEELTGGGAVVLVSGERRRAVALLDMAEFGSGPAGGVLTSFRGEDELAAALLDVTDDARPEVCFAQGHGELPLAAEDDGEDLAQVGRVLEHDAVRASELAALAPLPARCAVLAIVGPRRPLAPAEAAAVEAFLARGGRLLLAADAEPDAGGTGLLPTGLEGVLERHGVRLRPAVVMDPAQEAGAPLRWATWQGYGSHPIAAAFRGRRPTVWLQPRWIDALPVPGVTVRPLVSSSVEGWAETDLGAAFGLRPPDRPGDRDVRGPVAVAVAAERPADGSRLVVVGSARSFASQLAERGGAANPALFASSVAWLTGRLKLVGVGPKTPEQLRVVLTAAQQTRLFWICVVALPALAALAGAALLARRHRRGRA
jgi:ABC transporter family protein/ABC-2 family transporter